MRHFSGEFEGVRLLMLDELDAIAGGDGEDTDDGSTPPPPPPTNPDPNDIIVTGHRISFAPAIVDHYQFPDRIVFDLPPDPMPNQAGTFNITGGCHTANAATVDALDELSRGSAAAKAVIDAARESGLHINNIREDPVHGGDAWSTAQSTLSWDPFSALSGKNYDGSSYTETPIMSLMHELLHWANPNYTEYEVMSATNQIAAQMNQSLGTSFETHRDNHDAAGAERHDVSNVNNKDAGGRPACT